MSCSQLPRGCGHDLPRPCSHRDPRTALRRPGDPPPCLWDKPPIDSLVQLEGKIPLNLSQGCGERSGLRSRNPEVGGASQLLWLASNDFLEMAECGWQPRVSSGSSVPCEGEESHLAVCRSASLAGGSRGPEGPWPPPGGKGPSSGIGRAPGPSGLPRCSSGPWNLPAVSGTVTVRLSSPESPHLPGGQH